MSTKDSHHEINDCTNSPFSYTTLGSPAQEMLQSTTTLTRHNADNSQCFVNNGNHPFLRIIEQPQEYFRFRYYSEKTKTSGTHGCLLGKSYVNDKNTKNRKRTYPTVELVNYSGQALIKCHLKYQNNNREDLYKILDDEQNRDYSYIVPNHGSYKTECSGIEIHTYKKEDISKLLYRKFSEQLKNNPCDALEILTEDIHSRAKKSTQATHLQSEVTGKKTDRLRNQCKILAKAMNLNIVRLKFSAHDVVTGIEICDPVFSDPIHNNKTVTTKSLKICRMSTCSGKPSGREDVFMFVEQVDKKDIKIRFYEEDKNKQRVWSAIGTSVRVHYQYAIAFSTPPYRDPQTSVDVKVFIELVRPSDGKTSEPKEFTYKAEEVYKQIKKHRDALSNRNTSAEELSIFSGGSLINGMSPMVLVNGPPHLATSVSEWGLINGVSTAPNSETPGSTLAPDGAPNPMWFQPSAAASPALPQLQLYSAEPNAINRDVVMVDNMFSQADFAQYFNSCFPSVDSDVQSQMQATDAITSRLVSDSGVVKVEPVSPSPRQPSSAGHQNTSDQDKGNPEYPAFYKPDDAAEVKKSDIDAVDGHGNTALQIACGRATDDNSLEMVKLLLDRKADPLRHEEHNESAWRLSCGKPALRAALRGHVPPETAAEDDVKEEPDEVDEYESTDEDYRDDINLESLALKLEDVGLVDIANVIRRHIV